MTKLQWKLRLIVDAVILIGICLVISVYLL